MTDAATFTTDELITVFRAFEKMKHTGVLDGSGHTIADRIAQEVFQCSKEWPTPIYHVGAWATEELCGRLLAERKDQA